MIMFSSPSSSMLTSMHFLNDILLYIPLLPCDLLPLLSMQKLYLFLLILIFSHENKFVSCLSLFFYPDVLLVLNVQHSSGFKYATSKLRLFRACDTMSNLLVSSNYSIYASGVKNKQQRIGTDLGLIQLIPDQLKDARNCFNPIILWMGLGHPYQHPFQFQLYPKRKCFSYFFGCGLRTKTN